MKVIIYNNIYENFQVSTAVYLGIQVVLGVTPRRWEVLPDDSKELIAFMDCSALEDEGDTIIQRVTNHLTSDAVSCPRRPQHSRVTKHLFW